MGLSTADIATIFKTLGKYIFLVEQANAFKVTYETALMNLIQQSMNNHAVECRQGLFSQAIVSLNANSNKLISVASHAPALIVDNLNKYFKKVVSVMAGMAPYQDHPLRNILFFVRATMAEEGLYLDPAGRIAAFISGHLGYNDLPTTGTTLIPDTYITGDVI